MVDPLSEYRITRAGYVEERLRTGAAVVTIALLSGFCWALLIYAFARMVIA